MRLLRLRSSLLPHSLGGKRGGLLLVSSRKALPHILAGKPLPDPQQAAVSNRYSTLARRTSLMAQFHRVKAQFPDHLLLFQVGDFYELYGEDASESSTSSGEASTSPSPLSLVAGQATSKTSLRLTKKAGVLMAGFPVRALDQWQRELVEAGLQLAICNQQSSRKSVLLSMFFLFALSVLLLD